MSAPPYMKLFIADYLADTTHLTREQHGAYLLLLMAMWRAGGKLPNKDPKLAAIVKASPKEWAILKSILIEFFQIRGGAIRHKRLTKELSNYQTVSLKRKQAQKGIHSENAKENKPTSKRVCGHNQNQNQKGRIEASKKASISTRRVTADERTEGSSPPRSEVVIDFVEVRDERALAEAEADRMRQREEAKIAMNELLADLGGGPRRGFKRIPKTGTDDE